MENDSPSVRCAGTAVQNTLSLQSLVLHLQHLQGLSAARGAAALQVPTHPALSCTNTSQRPQNHVSLLHPTVTAILPSSTLPSSLHLANTLHPPYTSVKSHTLCVDVSLISQHEQELPELRHPCCCLQQQRSWAVGWQLADDQQWISKWKNREKVPMISNSIKHCQFSSITKSVCPHRELHVILFLIFYILFYHYYLMNLWLLYMRRWMNLPSSLKYPSQYSGRHRNCQCTLLPTLSSNPHSTQFWEQLHSDWGKRSAQGREGFGQGAVLRPMSSVWHNGQLSSRCIHLSPPNNIPQSTKAFSVGTAKHNKWHTRLFWDLWWL